MGTKTREDVVERGIPWLAQLYNVDVVVVFVRFLGVMDITSDVHSEN